MIKVILKDGSEVTLAEWQKIYGLTVGSDAIARNFTLRDHKIAQNLKEHRYLTIVAPLIMVADLARDKDGEPWIINAFNRTDGDQKRIDLDPRYAAAKVSPHVESMAMDVGCKKFDIVKGEKVFSIEKTKSEVLQKVRLLQEAAKELGIKIRIGYKEYQALEEPMYFVHYDVCPEYYAPGKPFHSKTHPWQWEKELTW